MSIYPGSPMSDHCQRHAKEESTLPRGDSQLNPTECTPHISYLPPEVLTRIFAFVIFGWPTFSSPSQSLSEYSAVPQTLVFAMVCRLWRDVTFSVPHFWAEITIYIPPYLPRAEKKAAHINSWVERSGVLSLSLFIHYQHRFVLEPPPSAPWDDPVRPIWDVIERHADRFETVHYDDPRFRSISETVSSLTRFFSFTSPSWSGLRRLYCHDRSAPFSFIKAVPWTQLTHIHIQNTHYQQIVFNVLKHCPNLIELHFSTERPRPSRNPFPIIWNNLRKLTAHITDFNRFFSAISLPSLEELRLTFNYGGPAAPARPSADYFVAFLKRSGCKLDTLKITDWALSSDELSSVLEQESCLSLTGLAVDFFWNTATNPFRSDIIERLTIGPLNPSPWCPNLLFLRLGPVQGGPLDTLVDMVASRLCRTRDTRIRYMVLKIVPEAPDYEEHLTDVAKRNGVTSICVETPGRLTFQAYTTCNHPF